MYFEDKIRSLTPHHEKMTVLQRSPGVSPWVSTDGIVLQFGMVFASHCPECVKEV